MINRVSLDSLLSLGFREDVSISKPIQLNPYNKNGGITRQKHSGQEGENCVMKLPCPRCNRKELYNMNDAIRNCEAIDLVCNNCLVMVQVKSYADIHQIHGNSKNELELKQGGSYRIMSDFVKHHSLIYAFLKYDPNTWKVDMIIYSGVLESGDISGPVGKELKCKIRFRNYTVIKCC